MTTDGNNLTSATAAAANVASMFLDRVQASADEEAFRYLVAGDWVSATWRQTADRVEALAAGHWASRPSNESVSRRARDTSGSLLIWRSCMPGPRPPPCIPAPTPATLLTS